MTTDIEIELDRIIGEALNELFPIATPIDVHAIAVSAQEEQYDVESSMDAIRKNNRQLLDAIDSLMQQSEESSFDYSFERKIEEITNKMGLLDEIMTDWLNNSDQNNILSARTEIDNIFTNTKRKLEEAVTKQYEYSASLENKAQQQSAIFSGSREHLDYRFEQLHQPLSPRIILFQSGNTEFDERNQHLINTLIIPMSSGDQAFDEENKDVLADFTYNNR